MFKRIWMVLLSMLVVITLTSFFMKGTGHCLNGGQAIEHDGATKTRLIEGYGKLPLHFEANQGQVEGTVRFLSRGSGYGLFLTSTGAVLTLRRANQASEKTGREAVNPVRNSSRALNPAGEQRGIISNGVNPQTGILRMKWEGANQNSRIEGVDELKGKSHYFIGNDPDQWRINIPLYRKVRYRDLYPGIDLIYKKYLLNTAQLCWADENRFAKR